MIMDTVKHTSRVAVGLAVMVSVVAFALVLMRQEEGGGPPGEADGQVTEGREQMMAELADARAELARMQSALEAFKAAARERYDAEDAVALGRLADELASGPPRKAARAAGKPPAASEPEPNVLQPAGQSVAQTADGFLGTMSFTPSKSDEPLTMLWLIVRLPGHSKERILSFAPDDAAAYTDISSQISPDGKFAAFKAMPVDSKPLQFSVAVSGPVVAHVRGTCGIEPFEFDLQADAP